jgi:acyl-coenzyme A thioesterase PaaI-like protein
MKLHEGNPQAPDIEALLAVGWKLANTPGFIEHVGPILYRDDGDKLRLGFIASPKHGNSRGVVQGGMIATFCDRSLAMGSRRINNNLPQATIELNIRFIDAVELGEFMEIAPGIARKTRSIVFMRGTVTADGRIVATADGIWKVLAK